MSKVALVVEDERLIRSLLTDVLSLLDFEVLEAETEEDAWNLYDQKADDISFIYTDVNLRNGNGVDLYHRIRRRSPSTAVVISSAMVDWDLTAVKCDTRGRFLEKPFTIDSFVQTVNQIQNIKAA